MYSYSGYVFRDAASISPFLEHPHTGPTSRFCAEMAEKLHCYVVAGYPERLEQSEITKRSDSNGHIIDAIGANSAVVHGPGGERIGGYRKTNLFETDQTWAKPGSSRSSDCEIETHACSRFVGTGFVTFNLPAPLNTVSLGICMDLNPQPPAVWTLEDGPYEIADYCRVNGTDLLILLNAWLDSGIDEDTAEDWHTLNYWASRLRPLWSHVGDDVNQPPAIIEPRRTVAIVCNRCGEENGRSFTIAFIYMILTLHGKARNLREVLHFLHYTKAEAGLPYCK